MSIASSNTSLRVPAGFRNLLEGLAREVLREQPTNVVAFAAQHFQKLLEQREGEWPCPAPALPSPAPRCIACSVCPSPGHQACPQCPLPSVSVLPHVPTKIRPLRCAHHPGHQARPLCPLPVALCLSQISTTYGHQAFHLYHPPGVVPVSCAHHPWYQLPIACAIKPPSSPAGGIDPVAWGAMLEDDRLTWPPSQVGCPPLQAPPENESEVPRPAPVPCSHPVPATLVPHHLNFLSSS